MNRTIAMFVILASAILLVADIALAQRGLGGGGDRANSRATRPRRRSGPPNSTSASRQSRSTRPGLEEERIQNGALLDSVEQQNRLISSSIQAEVDNELREARSTWPPIRRPSSKG